MRACGSALLRESSRWKPRGRRTSRTADPAAADVRVGQSRRQRSAEPGLPRFHERQSHAGLLGQPDQACRGAHVQGRVLPEPQLQGAESGAGGGSSFQGAISFANDAANPLDTGFGFANAALGVFTSYQQQSKFVEGSFIYDQIDWYVQDNWKVNSTDARLRPAVREPAAAVRSVPAVLELLPRAVDASAAPASTSPAVRTTPTHARATYRQARNPMTRQLLGPNTSLAIGQLVPDSGDALNGISWRATGSPRELRVADHCARAALRMAYDVSGDQRFCLARRRRPVLRSARTGTRSSPGRQSPVLDRDDLPLRGAAESLAPAGLSTQTPPPLFAFKYESELPSSWQWNAGAQFALPWTLSADVSYVGQHGFNLMQNVDNNAADFGAAFSPARRIRPARRARRPGRWRCPPSAETLSKASAQIQQELGHGEQHIPLDSDVVQPAVPGRRSRSG